MWTLATRALNCMWHGNLIHLSWIVEMHLTLAPRGNVDKSFCLGITLDSINFTWRGAGVWLMCRSGSLRSTVWLEASKLCFFCDSYVFGSFKLVISAHQKHKLVAFTLSVSVLHYFQPSFSSSSSLTWQAISSRMILVLHQVLSC